VFRIKVHGRISGSGTAGTIDRQGCSGRNLLAEGALGLALALALAPEVTTHAPQARATLGELDLGIRPTEVTPLGTPLSSFNVVEQLHSIVII